MGAPGAKLEDFCDFFQQGSPSGISQTSHCRSEEHTSELQSRLHLVCRLLLEKKKKYDEHDAVERIRAAADVGAYVPIAVLSGASREVVVALALIDEFVEHCSTRRSPSAYDHR